jgi:hypothetical protein
MKKHIESADPGKLHRRNSFSFELIGGRAKVSPPAFKLGEMRAATLYYR